MNLALIGRPEEAEAELARLEQAVSVDATTRMLLGIARIIVEFERATPQPPADALVAKVNALPEDQRQWASNNVLPVLLRHDAVDAAVRLIQRYEWNIPYDLLRTSPLHRKLAADPRMAPRVERARERYRETRAVLEAARARGELPAFLAATLAELDREIGPEP